ncbi:hypothetical protein EV651_13120 [Kribbella sp. VKM Ac-2571]|uniref:hypothetical protein n=1 Tax=Kribbella sp. VKM Ac-2571 TaxID=2512222 RepID=UPI0010602E0D|nr:hypothetical protein [Kribbella sp. VKM Ac-2571]TDO44836.1 hypothetical protein EV651_13120 [Kribbella sp. VKM Ac-2571]
MGRRSPLVTLAATAVGLVVLLTVNSTVNSTGNGNTYPTHTGGSTPTPTATTPAPATVPTVTPSATPSATPATTPATPNRPTAVYAGKTTEREATVAIAVKNGRAVAYVCDGRRLEAWLTGTFRDNQVAVRSRTGERLIAAVAAKSATGFLTLRGRTLRFAINVAGPPAGLYRSASKSRTIGWIVLPDGSQVGVDNDGTPAPAPRLDPARGVASVGGVRVTAQSITGDETF